MRVKKGDLLGIIDPQLSQAEMDIKIAKLVSAEADENASLKTRDEAKIRYERCLSVKNAGWTSAEELGQNKLAWERLIYEAIGKKAQIEVSRKEVKQTLAVLKQHEIRAPI